MHYRLAIVVSLLTCVVFTDCSKKSSSPDPVIPAAYFNVASKSVDGVKDRADYTSVSVTPTIKLSFSAPLNSSTVAAAVSVKAGGGGNVAVNTSLQNGDSAILITPVAALQHLTRYTIEVSPALKSKSGGPLQNVVTLPLFTTLDSADKFPRISDEALLTLVQKQTFKYFWDFGHPVSGLARERNTSGDLVTSGGSGFGIMAIVTGVHRDFITRAEGLMRIQKMVTFLKEKADRFHGAFPHWLNGATGKVIPFSTKDNGADLVETSFLMQGLLTARQFFNASDAMEEALRKDINELWRDVEWNWFRQGAQNVLYWHWSPDYAWQMDHKITGWNESLITYVLAASSPDYSIPKAVYDEGWAANGAIRNGNNYYGIQLPLGPPMGGPLFFSHYSFLGINPNGLSDVYANYEAQNKAHALINYNYSKQNPKGQFGYSDSVWGLTASDIKNGYTASSPTNDVGVIAPTAALSSFPYTPAQSMQALQFFYYKLGDKIWGEYGFKDAFNLSEPWFADSYLAIDQGPIIVMIENYRSGLLWNLFTSSPEVKVGMKKLGFKAPYL